MDSFWDVQDGDTHIIFTSEQVSTNFKDNIYWAENFEGSLLMIGMMGQISPSASLQAIQNPMK